MCAGRGLSESTLSVDLLGLRGECSPLDLLALREVLSFMALVTHTSCHPDDCSPAAPTPSPWPEKDDRDYPCDFFETSVCGRDALAHLSEDVFGQCS